MFAGPLALSAAQYMHMRAPAGTLKETAYENFVIPKNYTAYRAYPLAFP